jgi:hypothetical protein
LKQKNIRLIMAFLIKRLSVFSPYLSDMQSASFLRSSMLSCVASPAPPYFPTIPHKRHDFRK